MSWIDDIMANAPPGAFPWLDDLRDSAMRSGVMQGGPAPEAPSQAGGLTEANIGDLGGEGFSRRTGEGVIGEPEARRTALRQAIRGATGRDVRSALSVDVDGVRWFRDPRTGEPVPFSRVMIQPPYAGSPALTAEQVRNLDVGGRLTGGAGGPVQSGMFPTSGSTIRSVSPLEGKSSEEVAALKARADELLRAKEGAEAQALPTEDFLTIKALAARGAGPDVLAAAMAGLREKRQNEIKPFMLEMLREAAASHRQEKGIAATEEIANKRLEAAQAKEERAGQAKAGEDLLTKWEERYFQTSERIQNAVDASIERGGTKAQGAEISSRRQKQFWSEVPLRLRSALQERLGAGAVGAGKAPPVVQPAGPAGQVKHLAGLDDDLIRRAAEEIGPQRISELEDSGGIGRLLRGLFGVPFSAASAQLQARNFAGPAMEEIMKRIFGAMSGDPEVARILGANGRRPIEAGLIDLLAQALPPGGG